MVREVKGSVRWFPASILGAKIFFVDIDVVSGEDKERGGGYGTFSPPETPVISPVLFLHI